MLKPARFFSTACAPRSASSTLERMKRFWEHITVERSNSGAKVCLDGKPLKTPGGKVLEIPPEKPPILAELVANEWRSLPSLKLKSHMVPITALVGRALDLKPEERNTVVDQLMPYLDTDTLLVLSPTKDCEGQLRKAQMALFPVVQEEAEQVFGLSGEDEKLKVLDTEVAVFGNYQSPETKRKVREWMLSLDNFQFASLERATTAAKSLLVGMNIALNRRPVKELAMLSSLDVIHQTALWGEVEDTHDVDREDIHRLLGAAYIAALK